MTAPTVCVAVRFKDNPLVSWAEAQLAGRRRSTPAVMVAMRAFRTLGFTTSAVGARCVVFHVDPEAFNQHFATKLEAIGLSADFSHRILWSLGRSSTVDFRGPLERYESRRGVDGAVQLAARVVLATVESITIQRPHEFTATAAAFPNLAEPSDVLTGLRALLKVDQAMALPGGCTGQGVRVAMIDTGFAHSHPFFKDNGFKSKVLLAGAATGIATDPHGHGTGESANLFATAPGIDFVGVKTYDGSNPDNNAYALEGFIAAMGTQPDIVSMSFAYDLREDNKKTQMSELPDYVKDLAFEIEDAITSRGTIVVAAAGNDQYGFPGQMPGVISVGGANVHNGRLRASDFTSAFKSGITAYPNRWVPDVCGLVGMQPTGPTWTSRCEDEPDVHEIRGGRTRRGGCVRQLQWLFGGDAAGGRRLRLAAREAAQQGADERPGSGLAGANPQAAPRPCRRRQTGQEPLPMRTIQIWAAVPRKASTRPPGPGSSTRSRRCRRSSEAALAQPLKRALSATPSSATASA